MTVYLAWDRSGFYDRANGPRLVSAHRTERGAIDALTDRAGTLAADDDDVDGTTADYIPFNGGDYFVARQEVLA